MNLISVKRRVGRVRWLLIVPLMLALSFAASCGPAEEQGAENQNAVDQLPTATASPTEESGESEASGSANEIDAYPPPVQEASESTAGAYPPPQEPPPTIDAYPAPTEEPDGILLALDRPIPPGSTVVTGEGPPNLLIYIINMTLMGELEGTGLIGEDGKFSVTVPALEENVRVGVTTENGLGGLPDVNIRSGEGGFSVPQVGYFYDSVVVR